MTKTWKSWASKRFILIYACSHIIVMIFFLLNIESVNPSLLKIHNCMYWTKLCHCILKIAINIDAVIIHTILAIKKIGFSRTNVLLSLSLRYHGTRGRQLLIPFFPLHFHKNKFIHARIWVTLAFKYFLYRNTNLEFLTLKNWTYTHIHVTYYFLINYIILHCYILIAFSC